jgi:perosamine synthetase
LNVPENFINQIEPLLPEDLAVKITDYLKTSPFLSEFGVTRDFENKVKSFVESRFCVAVPSGTVALYLSLVAMGIGPGKRVAVPNFTMIATINAIIWCGAEPIVIDFDETLSLDSTILANDLNLDCLIYVTANGRWGNLDKIKDFCTNNNVLLIEDSAHALGVTKHGKAAGTVGDVGIYSLTPHKIITTGQGALIVTNDEEIFNTICRLKDFDRIAPATDIHNGLGFNFKFTDIQSLIGIAQFLTIENRILRKREIYTKYLTTLTDLGLDIMKIPTNLTIDVPWFVDIYLDSTIERDQLEQHLKSRNIGSRKLYPQIVSQKHTQNYVRIKNKIDQEIVSRGLWLPSSLTLQDEQIETICNFIKQFLDEKSD